MCEESVFTTTHRHPSKYKWNESMRRVRIQFTLVYDFPHVESCVHVVFSDSFVSSFYVSGTRGAEAARS